MLGFINKTESDKKISDLKILHQAQINKMNEYFSREKESYREKNTTHWQNKMKSQVMNFEETFKTINSYLETSEAREACIRKFNKIIK